MLDSEGGPEPGSGQPSEITPPAWRAGLDTQLENAVELAMDVIKKTKPLPIKRPSYPVYK